MTKKSCIIILSKSKLHKHKKPFIRKASLLNCSGVFVMQRGKNMNFYMNKDKSIMCPNCRKFLTKADSKDPRTHKLACKHCYKWIWYVPNNNSNFQIKEIPDSRTSSGMRFY